MKETLRDLIEGFKLWRIWSRLANREIQLSVKRTILGPLWLILHRVFFALAFSFLGTILWGRKAGLNFDVLIGFMVFSTMIGYLQSANTALISTVGLSDSGLPISVRLLKPWAKEFQLSILSGGVLILVSFKTGTLGWFTFFLIMVLTLIMSLWGLGLVFIISPAALRFRDVAQIVGFATTILMFFSPIFWDIKDIKNKELAEIILVYNPIADFIFIFRDLIKLGTLNSDYLMRGCLQTIGALGFGFICFMFSRRRIPYWS